MNHPLRFGPYTFYQASFGENDRKSVLQVVKNSGLAFPYVATVIVSVGLVWQFVYVLVASARTKRRIEQNLS